MKVIQLHVDGNSYYLSPDHDIRGLRHEVLAAVSGSPAFVTFRPVGGAEVVLLVTPHTSLRFETRDRPEPDAGDDGELMSDVDQYGFLDAA